MLKLVLVLIVSRYLFFFFLLPLLYSHWACLWAIDVEAQAANCRTAKTIPGYNNNNNNNNNSNNNNNVEAWGAQCRSLMLLYSKSISRKIVQAIYIVKTSVPSRTLSRLRSGMYVGRLSSHGRCHCPAGVDRAPSVEIDRPSAQYSLLRVQLEMGSWPSNDGTFE